MRTLRLTLAGAVNLARSVMGTAAGTFAPAGALVQGRLHHTATLLRDGRVLVVGGSTYLPADWVLGCGRERKDEPLTTSEVWDPATGSFAPAGSLPEGHFGHTATLLPDGRVLVICGVDDENPDLATDLAAAWAWDPATTSFEPAGALGEGRPGHTATLLSDGRVLVIGGSSKGTEPLATSEVWDPATRSFAPAGTLTERRSGHTATLLADGRVLVVGGWTKVEPLAGAEVWDPATRSFAPAGTLTEVRDSHTATLLPDGRVLVIGGADWPSTAAEVWDPTTATFTPAGKRKGRDCQMATLTLLPDGRILVVGWAAGETVRAKAEVWDPATGSSAPAGSIAEVRTLHTATLLPDGRVLVIGGQYGQLRAMAEVWSPAG